MIAVHWEDTITLGSGVVVAILAAASLIRLFFGVRWRETAKASSAAADELRKSLGDEKDRADRLERLLHESKDELAAARETIERLSKLEDIEKIVTLMSETFERIDQQSEQRLAKALEIVGGSFSNHEARAEERHHALLHLLRQITESLRPKE